jgi:hypothetical protein
MNMVYLLNVFKPLLWQTINLFLDFFLTVIPLKHFYDQDLNVSIIHQLHATNIKFAPLNTSLLITYQINSTIEDIINQLMLEELSINIAYEKYFAECDPLFCSYSYLEHRSAIDALTALLGLYDGLVIIMKIVVPILIKHLRPNLTNIL